MSNRVATYSVSSSIEIAHSYHFVTNVFKSGNSGLADLYRPWKRCLAIVDYTVYDLYGADIQSYFKSNDISATVKRVYITEDRKTMDTALEICNWITEFDLVRREPVLLIGGGLVTDVAGFSCAIYRRSTAYIRIPTTLIGLIDASVSNRVAVNWHGLKNRLGAYHEPVHTIMDATFLRSLPESEIRNGIAEILKITSCTHRQTLELLEKYGEKLIETHFGQLGDGEDAELSVVADEVIRQAIKCVLDVEIPNSREQDLNRVMYFGHTWSPTLELAVTPPLMHGHAVSVDICYSATLALHLGRISSSVHSRLLDIFSRLSLALDHPVFTLDLMKKGTAATIATRDGKLRAPVPTGELGTYEILPQVEDRLLEEAWELHKKIVGAYPRKGMGLEMTIDFRRLDNMGAGRSLM